MKPTCISNKNMQNGVVHDESYHLGHFLMDYFNNNPEDHVWQIDAGTGQSELKSSVKSRSIQLARCLRRAGLVPGDVLVVAGRNHLDVHIPFYAGYFNGLPISGIDPTFKYEEIKVLFETTRPKLTFCEVSNMSDYEKVIADLGLDTRIVTFGDGDKSLAKFIKKFDDNALETEFKVVTFDTTKVFAWLISTSGTTGLPKVAAFRHIEVVKILKLYSLMKQGGIVPALNLSTVHWISAYFATLSMPSANHIKVQTSAPDSVEHVIDMINKYKPVISTSSPLIFINIMKNKKYCDLTCFKRIVLSGFAMNPAALQQLKTRMRPESVVWNLLGQTECLGGILLPAPHGPPGTLGTEVPDVKVQLVDVKTGGVITEPNTIGELWTKGPRFTEYYNNPEATAAAISADGWFKTGDLLYRDENGFFFYVERMSSSFRVRNSYVMPMEIELVIQEHPDVVDVCVVGVPHPEDGKQALACVQRTPGSSLTEQELKNLVADKLSFHKHLHGGVIFVDHFPRTVSGKIARAKVRDFVLDDRKDQTSELPSSGNTRKLITAFQQACNTNNVRYVSTGRH